MQAGEAQIQRVLERSTQFLVPHYQRPYSWQEAQWKVLWRDLVELSEEEDPKAHFLGSIVTSPARSVPEGVEKRLLIDGQQRLTTVIILLTLIRNRARTAGNHKLAERLQDLITNRHDEGTDRYKLLPTQGEDPSESDRESLIRLIEETGGPSRGGIVDAARYFDVKLRRQDAPDLDTLAKVIINKLSLVSIILDEKDNPHRIFESLNGKGRPLSQADLIRNYFFMRLPEKEHERVYLDLWRPMQKRLTEEALTDFVRHYLTRLGSVIRETDVYTALKERIDQDSTKGPIGHLQELSRFSTYYRILLHPEEESSARIRERLLRLNRLEVTVAYPFVLGVYDDFSAEKVQEDDVCRILDFIENFLVRRFVCGVPTYGLNKVFAPLYNQARTSVAFVPNVARLLSTSARGYARDDEFRERLASARLYGGGDRREKTKLILERLEAALGHKEVVDASVLTLEHVMPQSPTDDWKAHLGPSWEEHHEQLLHTLGNLTLTSYNSELSNRSFDEKKALFAASHIELNRYFASVERWTAESIERRAEALIDQALAIWPYFGPHQAGSEEKADGSSRVTGTLPSVVRVRGEEIPVRNWTDVGLATVEAIVRVGDEDFQNVMRELPKFVNTDATAFRGSSRLKKLSNGAYLESNLSAAAIHRLCVQAVQLAGFAPDEWSVVYSAPNESEGASRDEAPNARSEVKKLQLEFWTEMRATLQNTGKFTSLQTPRAQYWFDVALGRSGVYLSLTANTEAGRIGVRLTLMPERAERALEQLQAQRAAIETEIGTPLEWNPYPDKRVKTIKLTNGINVLDRSQWPEAREWLKKTTIAFYDCFGPRVAQLDLKAARPV
jgi:uncharacterized protein with ParB-like and HNH nuclease domain